MHCKITVVIYEHKLYVGHVLLRDEYAKISVGMWWFFMKICTSHTSMVQYGLCAPHLCLLHSHIHVHMHINTAYHLLSTSDDNSVFTVTKALLADVPRRLISTVEFYADYFTCRMPIITHCISHNCAICFVFWSHFWSKVEWTECHTVFLYINCSLNKLDGCWILL